MNKVDKRVHFKFTDAQFLPLYYAGKSDREIMRALKLKSHTTVRRRREKLGLIANFKDFQGNRRNEKELLGSYEQTIKHQRAFGKVYYKNVELPRRRQESRERRVLLGNLWRKRKTTLERMGILQIVFKA